MPAIREIDVFFGFRHQIAPQGIGKPLRRCEDVRFLTRAGRYADDVNLFRLVRQESSVSKGPNPSSATGFGLAAAIIDCSSRRAPGLSAPSPGNFWFLASGTEISNPFPSSGECRFRMVLTMAEQH